MYVYTYIYIYSTCSTSDGRSRLCEVALPFIHRRTGQWPIRRKALADPVTGTQGPMGVLPLWWLFHGDFVHNGHSVSRKVYLPQFHSV